MLLLFSNHCNDNEEDSWLDAMEKGDLDNYGEIRKNRDPAIMTARQVFTIILLYYLNLLKCVESKYKRKKKRRIYL